MELYKRDDSPYWWGFFSINGKQRRFSTKRPLSDKAGAKRMLMQEYDKALNIVQFGQKPEISLKDAMDKTVASVEGKTKESYSTSRSRWLGLGKFNRDDHWHLDPDRLLSDLTQEDLDNHLEERAGEGLAANSIIIEVRFIQRTYNLMSRKFAVNRDLEFNKPSPFQKTRYLIPQESDAVERKLREHAGSPAYDKALMLFIVLLETGMRLSEALTLDWTEVDLTRKQIDLFRGKTGAMSLIPVSDRVEAEFRRVHNQAKPFVEMSRAVRVLRRVIDECCNTNPRINAQRGRATIHTLRDTYATRLLGHGLTLKEVSGLLGHTSVKMTEKYAHLEQSAVMEKARKALAG